MSTLPSRRWFRFNLRTMFVVVTVMALFVGYHVDWIRQRREFLVQEDEKRASAGITNLGGPQEIRAPGFLWFFGERGLESVEMRIEGPDINEPNATDKMRLQLAKELFPEAHVNSWHMND